MCGQLTTRQGKAKLDVLYNSVILLQRGNIRDIKQHCALIRSNAQVSVNERLGERSRRKL
jgi:accessory colonization factor AcfC